MSDPPFELWSNNAFRRFTHGSSYGHGSGVFAGLAAEVGTSNLLAHMAGIYNERIVRRFTTPEIEAELIRRSGQLQLARYFDRFVYGFGSPSAGTQPDLYMKDATDDTGATPYAGAFWLSPDVWVRNADDGGTTPQSPESGQDNWLYARVRNRGTATARSFVVGFKVNVWAGTEFVYPGDWFPLTAVAVGFDLPAGGSRIVKARWRAADIPPTGAHGCILAVAYHAQDSAVAGAHVWEHNNLAQRNVIVVNLVADEWAELVFRIGSHFTGKRAFHSLELARPEVWRDVDVLVAHPRPDVVKDLFRSFERLEPLVTAKPRPRVEMLAPAAIRFPSGGTLVPATGSRMILEADPAPIRSPTLATLIRDPQQGVAIRYDPGRRVAFPIALDAGETRRLLLRVKAPADARPGESHRLDLIQRDARGRAVGGISVQINVRRRKGTKV
jgi:hypothetical protein